MKNTIIVMAALIALGGCQQYKKLTGAEKDTAQIGGGAGWVGTMTYDGADHHVWVAFNQSGDAIGGLFSVEYGGGLSGQMHGDIEGGDDLKVTVDEGSLCVHKVWFEAEVHGGTMDARVVAQGNDIPGTTCFPHPIDTSFQLHRQ